MSPAPNLAHRHLARVVESSDDAIISKDLNGIITSWNRAAERIFGYTADEVDRQVHSHSHSGRSARRRGCGPRAASAPARAITHFETIRQRKDGTLIPISLTVSPIHDDANHVIGASKIARDISDRAEAGATARLLAAVVESSDDAIITKI